MFHTATRTSFNQFLFVYRNGFFWEGRMTGDGIFKLFSFWPIRFQHRGIRKYPSVPSAWTPAEGDPVLPKLPLHPAPTHIFMNITGKVNYQRWKLSCLPGNSGQGWSTLSDCSVRRIFSRGRIGWGWTASLCENYWNRKTAKACYSSQATGKGLLVPWSGKRWMVAGILTYQCPIPRLFHSKGMAITHKSPLLTVDRRHFCTLEEYALSHSVLYLIHEKNSFILWAVNHMFYTSTERMRA